jgi:hypothetical protein
LNFTGMDLRIELYDERVKGSYHDLLGREERDLFASRFLYLPAFGYFVFHK